MFKYERTNIRDEERSGRPSVVSNNLVQSVEQKIGEKRGFIISELACEFPQISRTLLYETVTVKLGYHKFFPRWVPNMLTGAHKTQTMASALTPLKRYHKHGDNFSITVYE
jgi:hypothetical protein